jgi:uncharacterized protein (TIGR02449 family)
MLTSLKSLEQKISRLIAYVAQLRTEKGNLHAENLALRNENRQYIERMSAAQKRLDSLITSIETPTQNTPQDPTAQGTR